MWGWFLKQGANPETGSDKLQMASKSSLIFICCYKSSCFESKRANVVIITEQNLLDILVKSS